MKSWDEIIGNKSIISHLSQAVALNRPAHAYAFNGDDGVGKRMAAEIFAKSLQCENRAEGSHVPCGVCRSCLQFESGNQPDIVRLTHEKSIISVDDVRSQIISRMEIRPYSSPYLIFLVDEAEKMNEQAQNALLKTLEEPPAYGIIILLTNNMSIMLETIRSRVVELDFMPVPAEDIKDLLIRTKHIPDYQAVLAAGASGGCPGLALRWVDSEEFVEKRENAERLLRKIGEKNSAQAVSLSKQWAKDKGEIEFFLRMLENWIRDVLLCRHGAADSVTMFAAELSTLKKQAERFDDQYFGEVLTGIDTLRERLRANVSTEIVLEDLLLLLF